MRKLSALVGVILLALVARPSAQRLLAAALTTPTTMKDLTFLTRVGCVNTPEMRNNLDGALTARKLPKDYQVIDIGTLKKTDPRRGYPTPTVLWNGRDLFGMTVPTPPFPEPS